MYTVKRWEPTFWLRDVGALEIAALYSDMEGDRVIVLAQDCPGFKIVPAGIRFRSYRVFDEVHLSLWGVQGVEMKHSFYRFDESPWLNELKQIPGEEGLRGFAIYTGTTCIEIAGVGEPQLLSLPGQLNESPSRIDTV